MHPSFTRRGTLKDDTKATKEDAALIHLCLRQKPLSAYRPYWSCSDVKRAGCAVLVKKADRRRLRAAEFDSLTRRRARRGRGAALEFRSFVLLNTYAQNNGWTRESFAKRRRWDAEVDAFLAGDTAGATPRPGSTRTRLPSRGFKPLIWTGDLNVCHREIDVTHTILRDAGSDGRKGKPPPSPPADPGDVGQPGSTPNERRGSSDSSPPTRSSTRTDSASGTLRTR